MKAGGRVQQEREALGWTQEGLAAKVSRLGRSVHQTTIDKIEKRDSARPQCAPELAKALGVNLQWLLTGKGPKQLDEIATNQHRIHLVGEVQAGKWVAPNSDGFGEDAFDIPLPQVYDGLSPYALRVVGQSMNLVYPEGTILICCHIEKLDEEPIPGKRYIIEDIDPAGDVETTVKELVMDDAGRPWAWPRSSHPQYQTPLALDQGRDGHTIRVAARVIFALRPE